MDKHEPKEKAVQGKELRRLEDEELDSVAGGFGAEDYDDDEDPYYYMGAPDD